MEIRIYQNSLAFKIKYFLVSCMVWSMIVLSILGFFASMYFLLFMIFDNLESRLGLLGFLSFSPVFSPSCLARLQPNLTYDDDKLQGLEVATLHGRTPCKLLLRQWLRVVGCVMLQHYTLTDDFGHCLIFFKPLLRERQGFRSQILPRGNGESNSRDGKIDNSDSVMTGAPTIF